MKENKITKQACADCGTALQFNGTEFKDEVEYDILVCPGCGLINNDRETLTTYEFDDDEQEEDNLPDFDDTPHLEVV